MKLLLKSLGYIAMLCFGLIYFSLITIIFLVIYFILVIIAMFTPIRFYYGKGKEKE